MALNKLVNTKYLGISPPKHTFSKKNRFERCIRYQILNLNKLFCRLFMIINKKYSINKISMQVYTIFVTNVEMFWQNKKTKHHQQF